MQKLKLTQSTKQQLKLRQIQFMSLLHLPAHKLEERIAKELADNPLLEEEKESDPAIVPNEKDTAPLITTTSIPLSRYAANKSFNAVSHTEWMNRDEGSPPSFQEMLLTQLPLLELPERSRSIAEYIIGNLTEHGYFPYTPAMVSADFAIQHYQEVTIEEVQLILQQIQRLDPPGIAAYDLQECLTLQLHRKVTSPITLKALKIVTDHFSLFAKKNYTQLARKLHCTLEELAPAITLLKSLRPYPVTPVVTEEHLLTPDFIVHVVDDDLQLTMIEKRHLRVKIRHDYQKLLKEHRKSSTPASKELVSFVQKKLNHAQWFVQAIQKRRQTLFKIMENLMQQQRAFFLTGDEANLKPIFLRNVAEHIGMDISTISRAIHQKSVQTQSNIHPLKFFFSVAIPTRTGKKMSSHYVKKRIQQFIAQENRQHPYTDKQLTAMLVEEGFQCARRTVMKYRQQLGFSAGRMRREIEKSTSPVR